MSLLFIWTLVCPSVSLAQDLFDEENTLRYANYLYNQGNYALAIPEFERLVFYNPEEIRYKAQLVESYFNTGEYQQVETSIDRWTADIVEYPLSLYYLKSRLRLGEFTVAQQVVNSDEYQFPKEEIPSISIATLGLSGEWDKASEVCRDTPTAYHSVTFQNYCQVVGEAQNFNEKNKFVAAGLSMLIPGLGKVYTKDYVDGIANLLFVGATAFQSYRGFKNDDINDLQGWIYGGAALSFYLGNIYGSWLAANRYNDRFYESKQKELDISFFGQ